MLRAFTKTQVQMTVVNDINQLTQAVIAKNCMHSIKSLRQYTWSQTYAGFSHFLQSPGFFFKNFQDLESPGK